MAELRRAPVRGLAVLTVAALVGVGATPAMAEDGAPDSAVESDPLLPVDEDLGDGPAADVDLALECDLTDGGVEASWTDVAGASSARVSLLDVTTGIEREIADGDGTRRAVNGLVPGNQHLLTLTVSVDGSTDVVESCGFLADGAPAAPSALEAHPGHGTLQLTWQPPLPHGDSPVLGYDVELRSADEDWTVVADTQNPDHVVSDLVNGTEYQVRVRARNGWGAGAPSDAVTAVPRGAPSGPSSVVVEPGDRRLVVSWTAPATTGGLPITGYRVEQSSDGLTWVQVDVPATTLSHTLSGLQNGLAYDVRVSAHNEAEHGPASPVVTGSPQTTPSEPLSVTVTPGNGSAQLSWTPPASDGGAALSGFRIERSTNGTTWTAVSPVVAGGSTGHLVAGLTNGTRYQLRVIALNASGSGAVSAVVAVTPRTVPSAPRTVTAKPAAGGALAVTWQAPSSSGGAPRTSYVVQYSTNGTSWTTATSTAASTATGYTFKGLKKGTRYQVRVRAVNAAGSSAAGTATATTWNVSSAPRSASVKPGNGTLAVTWKAPSSIGGAARTSYVVQYSTNGTTWTTASRSIRSSATSYTIKGLKKGTRYQVRVIAMSAAGTGAAGTTAGTTWNVSSAPRSVSAKPGNGTLAVTWKAPTSSGGSARTSYLVQYSTNGTTWKTASSKVKPKATTYTITGLKNGTRYQVRVIAVNSVGKSAPASTSGTPRTKPSAPRVTVSYPGSGELVLRWGAPASGGSAITGYVIQRQVGGSWRTVKTVGASTRQLSVERVRNGSALTYRVLARNGAGSSAWSSAVKAVPRAPSGCNPNYGGVCVPIASDVDCAGGDGNGPKYVRGPVYVLANDPYGLDRDGDGIACER